MSTHEKLEELLAVLKSVYLWIKPHLPQKPVIMWHAHLLGRRVLIMKAELAISAATFVRLSAMPSITPMRYTFMSEQRQALLKHKNDAIAQASDKPHKWAC